MTVFTPSPIQVRPLADRNVAPFTPRPDCAEREFGTGYRRSSGYAAARRYTSNWAPQRFRCA